jgi:hypothetical protein
MKEEKEDCRYYRNKAVQGWAGGVMRDTVEEGIWLLDHQTMTAVCMRFVIVGG